MTIGLHTNLGETLRELVSQVPGLEGAEVVVRATRALGLETRDLALKSSQSSDSVGSAVRLLRGGRMAQSFAKGLDPEALRGMVARAAQMLDEAPEDKSNAILPLVAAQDSAGALAPPPDLTFALVPTDEKVQRLLNLEANTIKAEALVTKTDRTLYREEHRKEWLWTLGTDRGLSQESTRGYLSTTAIAERDHQTQTGTDFDLQTHYYNLDWGMVARSAASQAVRLLGGKPVPSGRYNVIFTQSVMIDLMSVLAPAFSGDNFRRGFSFMMGHHGEKVFSENVNLIDDPHLGKVTGTCLWDAEGVPTRRLSLVRGGVFDGLAHNYRSAREMNCASTGNAARVSEATAPEVGFHNFFLEPGSKDFVDLLRDLSSGLVIHRLMGLHTANPITGEFSFGAVGTWLDQGELKAPVAGITVAGNLKSLLGRTLAVGRDLKWGFGFGAPSALFEGVSVAGA